VVGVTLVTGIDPHDPAAGERRGLVLRRLVHDRDVGDLGWCEGPATVEVVG
jgi:hypothetical protein